MTAWNSIDGGLWHRSDGRGIVAHLEFAEEETWVGHSGDFLIAVDTASEAMLAVDWVLQTKDHSERRR